ncbi:hypothetical protein HK101_005257 [Irineochytrium annulatum]|nr:hypothetical protein HK101_005257 [Irineochytrium annulatum]
MESSELRASLPDLNTAGLGAALADLNTAVFGDNAVSADEHEMMEDLKMVETMSRGTTESQGVLFRSSSESVNVLRGSIARRLSREVSMSVVKLPDIDHFSNIVPKRVERENGGNGFAVSQKGVPAVPADTERQQAARHEAKELTMRQESTERLKEPDSVKPRMSDILCKIVRRHTDRRDDEWDYKDNHPMSLLNLEMTLPKMPIIFRAQEPLRAAQSHQPQSIPLPGVGGTDVLRRQIWCTLQGGTRLIPPSAGGQQHGPVARTRDLFTKERIWSIKIPAKDVPGVDGKEGIGSRRQYDDSAREANVGATIASVRGLDATFNDSYRNDGAGGKFDGDRENVDVGD